MPKDLPRTALRTDWTRAEAEAIYHQPFMDLLFQAQSVHRAHFDPNRVQMSRLLSVKTGGCAEDCSYCSQSARNGSTLPASKLMPVERVLSEHARPRRRAPRAIAWAPPGASRRTATWRRSRPWCAGCARWEWKPA